MYGHVENSSTSLSFFFLLIFRIYINIPDLSRATYITALLSSVTATLTFTCVIFPYLIRLERKLSVIHTYGTCADFIVSSVYEPVEIIAMQIFRMNVEFQVLITESKSTETKHHCLNNTGSASFY